MTAADDIFEANVKHAVYLQRYSSGQVKKISRLIEKMEPRLIARLQREDLTLISRARYERLLDGLRKTLADTYALVANEMRTDLRDLGAYEAGFQSRMIASGVPVQVELAVPSAAQLYSSANARPFQGRLLRDWFKELEAGAFRRIKDEIAMGVAEGRTTDQIVRAIRGTARSGYKDGILSMSRRGAEAMVRTATNHTASVARNEVYKGNEDLIKGVRYVATLDGRTTPRCRALDGEVFPLKSGPRPPQHIGCRSTTTPVLKSWKELGIDLKEVPPGTRSSMNGQVSSTMNYDEWLRTQPKAFQNKVLGKGKADIFRQGVSVKKFVNKSGREYTLDELRKSYPGAAGAAASKAKATAAKAAAFKARADAAKAAADAKAAAAPAIQPKMGETDWAKGLIDLDAKAERGRDELRLLRTGLADAMDAKILPKGYKSFDDVAAAIDNIGTKVREAIFTKKEVAIKSLFGNWDKSGTAFGTTNRAIFKTRPYVKADELISGLVHPRIRPRNLGVKQIGKKRAFYDQRAQAINVPSAPSIRVLVHEAIHDIEFRHSDVLKKTAAFLKKRSNGEPLVKFNGEAGWADKWVERGGSQYTGRKYAARTRIDAPVGSKEWREFKSEEQIIATEILTMGAERLISAPLQFATNDPDFFNFVMDIFNDRV